MKETAIVVGVDGSRSGDAVVRQSALLAAASGAWLHIVAPAGALERLVRSVFDTGVRIEAHKAAGDLAAMVWQVAKQVEAETIVLERPARTPLQRALRAVHRRLAPDAYAPVELIDTRAGRARAAGERRLR